MRAIDFIRLFQVEGQVPLLAEGIRTSTPNSINAKGLSGSLDSVIFAASFSSSHSSHLLILQDKEEASYFHNDLQHLLPEKAISFFPNSYKRPYEYDETENANILLRAEVLTRISNHPDSQIIVTYPEALSEKVITKKSLVRNTFKVKVKHKLDLQFLEEFLFSFDFEKTDFVHEAGQFAARGGIVDVFSFASELPYRIEMAGDEVDSIRTFDPGSQLSVIVMQEVSLLPDVQTRLVEEDRQSMFEFLPATTRIWIKDYELTLDLLQKSFDKATGSFETITRKSGTTSLSLRPDMLFLPVEDFKIQSMEFKVIEFGNRFSRPGATEIKFPSTAQPPFKKNFELLARDLAEHQAKGYTNIISSDQPRQLERLHGIFEEIHPDLRFVPLECSLRSGFVDHSAKILCYTDHQIFERFHRYRPKERFTKSKALTFRELSTLQPGDFVTHIDYGIGKFAGLEKKEVDGKQQESIRLVFRDDDLLYASIHSLHKISKYSGKEGTAPIISKLGSSEWETKKARVKKKIKDIARDLIALYAKRKQALGFSFSPDSFLQAELESSFIYEDTPDQARATEDVKRDMEALHPMDRLICGDVGFGKTEVAIRAAFKAATEGKQVAVLVPTTILAMQHFRTFSERLANFPVHIEYVSRFKSEKEIKRIMGGLKDGKVNIMIGTHRVVSSDVEFKDLGLLIVDEEQKFGVKVKDRLKELKVNVDVLTLTATPIPRTLHFSLMGARDLSIIATPPPNRQPVNTELHTYDEVIIRDAISAELRRGGQVFFVHNRIHDIEGIANVIFKLVPDARIGIAHGQMEGDKLEKVMVRFIEGEYDVLVSTNIIESGLDIPNANTIIINQAHMFGLSDLHQMRGRVGRSNKKAFCYLLTPPASILSSDSKKRLMALEEFSELGDGFRVAMRDLDIRGAGNLLGSEQSGFINDLGFDTYHKILDDAMQELKEEEFKELFKEELSEKAKLLVPDCTIETDLEVLIPEIYINSISERLHLYSMLDNIKNETELITFCESLQDRFGPIPEPVDQLINSVRLRWLGEELGFEKISIKNNKIKSNLLSENPAYYTSGTFNKIIQFVKGNSDRCRFSEKTGKAFLIITNINSVMEALEILRRIVHTESPARETLSM